MLDLFLIKVSHKTNSFPIVPSILRTTDGSIGRFDNSDGKCKIDLLINAKRQTCIVEKLVKSRWLPADLAEIKSKVPAHTIAWNGGIYPDAGSGIQCTVGPDELNDSMKSRTIQSMNTRTVERIELLELSSIEDELVTLGAGHSSSCDTIGYTGMKFRVSIELGFRAIEKNTCGLGSIVRKTKFLEGKQAVTDKIFGCFTEKDFERYVMRANEWLDAAETDCKGIAGRKVRELANDAVEWVVDQS
jgi:hypothetical protein